MADPRMTESWALANLSDPRALEILIPSFEDAPLMEFPVSLYSHSYVLSIDN